MTNTRKFSSSKYTLCVLQNLQEVDQTQVRVYDDHTKHIIFSIFKEGPISTTKLNAALANFIFLCFECHPKLHSSTSYSVSQ